MAGVSRVDQERRLERGQAPLCARGQHERCEGGACTCRCHTDPNWAEQHAQAQARARRAAETMRSRGQPIGRRPARETAAAETAPKRPDLKPGVKAAVPAAAARQIKSEFSLVLWGGDQAAARALPKYWTTPEDRLTDDERTQLVTAIYAWLEARFPRVLVLLSKVGESAPEALLLYTVAVVAAPRLARHGLIPAELASAIVFAPIILANLQQQPETEPGAAGVGAESAPVGDRANGDWQEHVSVPPLEIPPVQAGAAVETGFSGVRHGSSSQNGSLDHGLPL